MLLLLVLVLVLELVLVVVMMRGRCCSGMAGILEEVPVLYVVKGIRSIRSVALQDLARLEK